MFHVSLLNKCIGDSAIIVPVEDADIKDYLSNEKVPVEIFNRQICRLRNKEVPLVKVFCSNQSIEGATWEAEEDMGTKYPHLFSINSDSA